jgi:hypothetical protein
MDLLFDAGLICFAVLLSFPTVRDLLLTLRARGDSDRTSAEPPGPEAELDSAPGPMNEEALLFFKTTLMGAKEALPTPCRAESDA